MSTHFAQPRICAAACLAALLAATLWIPACRRGADPAPTTRPRPVAPYPGYFQTRVGDDIYLFATLAEKSAFHSEPLTWPGFDMFMSRNRQRVFISNTDPLLVPRIRVAFEQARGTELAAADPVLPVDGGPSTAPVPP